MSDKSEHHVYAYQMILLAIEKTSGHKALEETINVMRERDSVSYLYFLQTQIKAKRDTALPYWDVSNVDGQYKLTKVYPK